MPLEELIELYTSLGIFVVATGLSTLSYLAWRREHVGRMRAVTVGYTLFAVYGLIVFLEYPLRSSIAIETLELVEHGSAVLILGGLITFFLALTHD